MKDILKILVFALVLSCAETTPKNEFVIIYEFENPKALSTNDKQGTIGVLNKRLEEFASNYQVRLNNKHQIEVTLKTNYLLESVNAILTNPGKLEFWECIDIKYLNTFFRDMFEILETEYDDFEMNAEDSYFPVSGGLLSFAVADAEMFKTLLQRNDVLAMLPRDIRRSKFLFGHPQNGRIDVYLVKLPLSGNAFINESHIIDASQSYNVIGRPTITMSMNTTGAQRWERMTQIAYEKHSQIAITLNDVVYSAPSVISGAILGGNTEISGNFTEDQARDLANVISSRQRIPKLKFVSASANSEE